MQLTEARDNYNGFKIPLIVIPATMSNNVPGTYFSLGADTTLNVIVEVNLESTLFGKLFSNIYIYIFLATMNSNI